MGKLIMGLFNRKKKKQENTETYKPSEEYIQQILTDGVDVEVGMGVHGNDELVAGAMLGSTGKLIAMNNYGKIKYQPTRLLFHDDYIMFQINGQKISYSDLYRWEKRKVGLMHAEFVLLSYNIGEIPLKATNKDFLAIIEALPRAAQAYVDRMNQQEAEAEHGQDTSDMDRLIRLGELHERGLLSDDEFAEAKKKLI